MAYYSEKYARKQKRDREIMVASAKDLIAHPKKYDKVTAAGSGAYVQYRYVRFSVLSSALTSIITHF